MVGQATNCFGGLFIKTQIYAFGLGADLAHNTKSVTPQIGVPLFSNVSYRNLPCCQHCKCTKNYFSFASPYLVPKMLSHLVSQGVTFTPTAFTFGAHTALCSELLMGDAVTDNLDFSAMALLFSNPI